MDEKIKHYTGEFEMKGLSKQEEDDLLEVSREAHSEEREAQADSWILVINAFDN